MKAWKYKLVPMLFALGGLGWLVRIVKQLIQGDWPDAIAITFASTCFLFAVIFRAAGVAAERKSEGSSGAPSA